MIHRYALSALAWVAKIKTVQFTRKKIKNAGGKDGNLQIKKYFPILKIINDVNIVNVFIGMGSLCKGVQLFEDGYNQICLILLKNKSHVSD